MTTGYIRNRFRRIGDKRVCFLAGAWVAVAGLAGSPSVTAFTIPDFVEQAQLSKEVAMRRDDRTCRAASGTPVLILGRPSGLLTDNEPERFSIRVLAGSCLNFEATVSRSDLKNIVSTGSIR